MEYNFIHFFGSHSGFQRNRQGPKKFLTRNECDPFEKVLQGGPQPEILPLTAISTYHRRTGRFALREPENEQWPRAVTGASWKTLQPKDFNHLETFKV